MANILILGATSAVATQIASHYAAGNNKLVLIARNQDKLHALAMQLGEKVVASFQADFNETSSVSSLIEKAVDSLGTVDLAIFAHGVLGDQIKSENDFEHAHEVIHSNYLSVIALLIPLANKLKRQKSGKIGVLVSVAGDRGRPRNFTYGSAKGALNIYLQGLRSSLYGSGVEVYSFKLGPVDTPMTVDHEKNFSFSTKEKVAQIIVEALEKRKYCRYVPGYWFWVMWVVRWLPESLFQKLKFLSAR